MDGAAIAALPLGAAGLGTLAAGFPGSRPISIRIDAVLGILAEAAEERAAGQGAEPAAPAGPERATRP